MMPQGNRQSHPNPFCLPTFIPAGYSDHGFEDLRQGFESWLCHIPIVWPQSSNITSVGLSFLIWQMGIVTVYNPFGEDCRRQCVGRATLGIKTCPGP